MGVGEMGVGEMGVGEMGGKVRKTYLTRLSPPALESGLHETSFPPPCIIMRINLGKNKATQHLYLYRHEQHCYI